MNGPWDYAKKGWTEVARRYPTAIVVAAMAVIVGVLTLAWLPDASSLPDPGIGDEGGEVRTATDLAPDTAFEDLDGGVVHLDQWLGRPLVVNFWASWCPPCVAEMRDTLEPLHQEFGDKVVFLGINLQDDASAADRVVAETGVTYDLAVDPDGNFYRAFGGFAMPTTYLIDADGRVLTQHAGAINQEDLREAIVEHFGL